MSAHGRMVEITDPLAIFLECGDRVVVVADGKRGRSILGVRLQAKDRKLKDARREHYQRVFHKGLMQALEAGTL